MLCLKWLSTGKVTVDSWSKLLIEISVIYQSDIIYQNE